MLNRDDPWVRRCRDGSAPGDLVRLRRRRVRHVRARWDGRRPPSRDASRARSRRSARAHAAAGTHNLENMMAAVTAARSPGPRPRASRRRSTSSRLAASLQLVRERDGVRWVDDSKGTNVGAVVRSLASVDPPVILLAGGVDKGGDYDPLRDAGAPAGKRLLLFGAARETIRRALGGETDTVVVSSLAAAVAARRRDRALRRHGAALAGVRELRHVPRLRRARASASARWWRRCETPRPRACEPGRPAAHPSSSQPGRTGLVLVGRHRAARRARHRDGVQHELLLRAGALRRSVPLPQAPGVDRAGHSGAARLLADPVARTSPRSRIRCWCCRSSLLVLVLVPGIGVVRGGARRWLELGLLTLQPSEIAKLVGRALSRALARQEGRSRRSAVGRDPAALDRSSACSRRWSCSSPTSAPRCCSPPCSSSCSSPAARAGAPRRGRLLGGAVHRLWRRDSQLSLAAPDRVPRSVAGSRRRAASSSCSRSSPSARAARSASGSAQSNRRCSTCRRRTPTSSSR